MLTNSQKAQFERDGYVLVPGVLSTDRVRALRKFLLSLFDRAPSYKGDYDNPNGNIRFDACAHYEELRGILLNPQVVGALRDLLGEDFVYLPESVVHDSVRGHWHKDTSAQEKAGHRFHYETDYRMVQAAIYFQDNTTEYGGGLEIIPASFKSKDTYSTLFQRVANRLRKKGLWPEKSGGISVPSRAGDLILFQFRSDHRGTPATVFPIPPEGRKLALFFPASRNNRHVESYCNYIGGRTDYAYLKEHRYPEEFLEEARSRGVSLARPPILSSTLSGPRKIDKSRAVTNARQ